MAKRTIDLGLVRGNGITSIIKTSTSGLVDTYTITYDNGDTETFNVTNGQNGAKGDKGDKGDAGGIVSSSDDIIYDPTTGKCTLSNDISSKLDYIDTQKKFGYLGGNDLNITLNLLKSRNKTGTWSENVYSLNGLTFIVNDDMTIKVNGTASSTTSLTLFMNSTPYPQFTGRLVGCPSGGGSSTYLLRMQNSSYGEKQDVGNGINLTNYEYYYLNIRINSGYTCNNVVFKPMLTTDLSATYDDYTQYSKSNVDLTNTLNDLEDRGFYSKNIVENTLKTQTLTGGATLTVNDDKSITINGTVSSAQYLFINEYRYPITDDLILSGGASPSVFLYARKTDGTELGRSNGSDVKIKSTDTVQLRLGVMVGTYSNVKVYPMIRYASIVDSTYEPYAKSNSELTEELATMSPIVSTLNSMKHSHILAVESALTSAKSFEITFNRMGIMTIASGNSVENVEVFILYKSSSSSNVGMFKVYSNATVSALYSYTHNTAKTITITPVASASLRIIIASIY